MFVANYSLTYFPTHSPCFLSLQVVQDVLPPLSEPLPPPASASGERRALRAGSPLSSLPFPVTYVGSLEFEVPQVFKLIKTAPAVVNKAGQVIVSTPAGTLYGLANPDIAGASWATQQWVQTASDDEIDNSCCYDLVLDSSDSMYQIITDRNLLQGYVYGYRTLGTQTPPALWPGLDLGANLQLFEFYHISALEAGAGQLLVPTVSLLTQVGAVWVNTATGTAVNITIDSKPNGYGDCVGNAWIDATNGAACMLTHANGLPGVAMQTWAAGSATATWSSTGVPSFTADITQANPTVDPWTKRVYWVGLKDPVRPAVLYCVLGAGAQAGQACPGFAGTGKGPGVDIKNLWQAAGQSSPFPIQWVFAGSIVPAGNAVGRLLFSFTLSGNYQMEAATGCIMALSPASGALLDSYCVPRDPAGVYGVDNFLATAPIVALDARGVGAHTAIVSQFDMITLAFDPNNLAAGPLYAATPLPAGNADSVASDFLSMTAGGTLLIPAWNDDDADWSVYAVPGILKLAPSGGPTAATGLSGGQKAGIAFGVIFAVGALGAFWWFGGVEKLRGALGGVSFGGSSAVGGAGFSSSSSYSRVSAPSASPYKSYT